MSAGFSLSRLKSGRALSGIAVAVLALAGGWYFFLGQTPQTASASFAPRAGPSKSATLDKKKTSATTRPDKPHAATQPVVAPPPPPVVKIAPPPPVDPLGPAYFDDANGFAIRFPDGWPIRAFSDEPWVLDCGDPSTGMISIGFSPCPEHYTVDQLLPEAIARRIKRRKDTVLVAQGRNEFAGYKAIWSKSTGPLPMTHGAPRMTRVHYIVPLGNGRVLEVRVAAPPEKFDKLAGLMRDSLATFEIVAHRGK